MKPTRTARAATVVRAAARATGLATFMLVVAFAAGQGLPDPSAMPLPVALEFFFLLVMTGGALAGWRWEVAGALATPGALACFNLVELVVNQEFAGPAFLLFAVPAILYLADAWLRRSDPVDIGNSPTPLRQRLPSDSGSAPMAGRARP